MNKVLAFDVDGTLSDVYSNIQPGVQPVFLDNRVLKNKIIFATGNTITTINTMRQNLLKLNPKLNKCFSYSACLGGSIIYDNLDNIVFQKFLCRKKLVKYLDRCVKLDPQCFFMFMLEDRQVFAHTNDEFKSYIVSKFGKMNMDQNEMSFNDEDYHTFLKKLPRIYTVNIFSVNNFMQMYNDLLADVKQAKYFTYIDFRWNMVQISSGNKYNAVRYMVKKLKEQNLYNKDIKDVVYFGDGENDIDCLKMCNFSIARGSDLPQKVVDAATVYAEDVTPYLNKIFK